MKSLQVVDPDENIKMHYNQNTDTTYLIYLDGERETLPNENQFSF